MGVERNCLAYCFSNFVTNGQISVMVSSSMFNSVRKSFFYCMSPLLILFIVTLFSSNMSGFLLGHSCCTVLVKMVDDWRLALDSKKVTGSIAIDLSKVFDSICHNLLLAKLRAYGVGEEAVDFLHSYLSGR